MTHLPEDVVARLGEATGADWRVDGEPWPGSDWSRTYRLRARHEVLFLKATPIQRPEACIVRAVGAVLPKRAPSIIWEEVLGDERWFALRPAGTVSHDTPTSSTVTAALRAFTEVAYEPRIRDALVDCRPPELAGRRLFEVLADVSAWAVDRAGSSRTDGQAAELAAWLEASAAPFARGLVHGDFWHGNVAIGDDGEACLLDWSDAYWAIPGVSVAQFAVQAYEDESAREAVWREFRDISGCCVLEGLEAYRATSEAFAILASAVTYRSLALFSPTLATDLGPVRAMLDDLARRRAASVR